MAIPTVSLARRKVLLVYPRFAPNNLLNFEWQTPFYPGKRAVMPPLGLLILAGLLVQAGGFELRIVDENVQPLENGDLAWADVVALSGMHPQRRRIIQILEEAKRLGKLTVLGGPSVSICPEYYPQADFLHVGEIGDATAELIHVLRHTDGRSRRQRIFRTENKTPLDDQPLPALKLIEVNRYIVIPMQFSVGCPYTCEFCDIPAIYGRIARTKSTARIVRELDCIRDTGFVGTILFVDDNLIANRKALRAMLPAVIAWQKQHQYPYPLTGEATINISREPEILRLLHDARFTHLFLGVESSEEETLRHISKKQNTQDPLIESIRRIQAFGFELILGMIIGFDTDTPETGVRMARFLRQANAPIVYFNLLAALPKTPLWERLKREERLIDREGDTLRSEELLSCLTSNVRYKLPQEMVRRMLCDMVAEVYSPEEVYRRYLWNAKNVFGSQIQGMPPMRTRGERKYLMMLMIGTLLRVVRDGGFATDHRKLFWRYLWQLIKLRQTGKIGSVLEPLLRTVPIAHHLVVWGRELAHAE
jgi:hopanoid C-2 methylase